MKIYTKTGDQGMTSLFGGKRLHKSALRIDAYGTVDELNSWIGLVRDQPVNQERQSTLIAVQNCLFVIGSTLAAEPGNTKITIPALRDADIALLETEIDAMDSRLEPMRFFILPGGNQAVSFCHVARTVCRRAERLVVALSQAEPVNIMVIQYLNRLSDYLFMLARKMNQELGVEETPWKGNS